MTIILLLLLVSIALAWHLHRSAAETAIRIGRDACTAAGVQWLDQSVHLTGMRLRRHDTGTLGVERSYRFDYSRDGEDRYRGGIVLLGSRLLKLSGPVGHTVPTLQ